MSALLLVLLVTSSADPCADVFDRTDTCAAVDSEALPAPVDPVPPITASSGDVGLGLGWRFLAGSTTAAVLATAAGVGVLFYDARLATLYREGRLTPQATDELLLQRGALQIGAGAMLITSALLAGTATAFFVFDPTRGRAREPFILDDE